MTAMTKPIIATFHLPRWAIPRLSSAEHQRKRATIDLIHSSPHLLRDIGMTEGNLGERRK
ncbi:hypothetical protein [Devosia sp. SL43]|uniref:hypothetical protein n=1 Tax=Devosia sp. SL43 TaxID=2806348 RepID=UPI001F286419|nr:hypothetical protein [Devosia sp. SL43]UJW85445.1 hypothetical protein IM737_18940 [Devosia sp. SL43]